MGAYSNVKYSGVSDAGVGSKPIEVESSATTIYAIASGRYVVSAPSITTIVLPETPEIGDIVTVIINNNLLTNVINRNGNKIMGDAEDLVLNLLNASVALVYVNSEIGWRII